MATLVYRYGVRAHGSARQQDAVVSDPAMLEQLRLGHELRNALVGVQHRYEDGKRAVWSGFASVAAADHRVTTGETAVAELEKQARAEHSADRTAATRQGTAESLKAARAAVKQARADRKAAMAAVAEQAKPKIQALGDDRDAEIKDLYRRFCQDGVLLPRCGRCAGDLRSDGDCTDCGAAHEPRKLYWATYNAIREDHQTAVKLVEAKRKAGQPARLRFRRWTGDGTLTVQLQRMHGPACRCVTCAEKLTRRARKTDPQAPAVAADPAYPPTDPPRDPALLASGQGKWRNVLQLGTWIPPGEWSAMSRAERRRVGRSHIGWQLGGGRQLTLPVQLHRQMPADADVAMAQLTRVRVGGRHRMSVALTAKLPDPPQVQGLPPVALHLGWRQRPDGSLRVATWACPQPLDLPPAVADVVVSHGGRWGEVIMPARWLADAEVPPRLLGRRDKAMEPVLEALADWLEAHTEACTARMTPALVRRWRSQGRLAGLTNRWRGQPPTGSAEILTYLEAWRIQDKLLWERESHLRRRLAARRDDAWRRVASWLARHAGVLVVDDADIAELRRRDDPADTDPTMPASAAQAARARAALAAPGRLRHLATITATRDGLGVHTVASAGLTRLHRKCGHQAQPDPRYAASAVVTCPGCGNGYDQDYNAAMLMLDRQQQP